MEKYLAYDTSRSEIIVCAYNGKNYAEKRLNASGTEHVMVLIDSVLKKLKMDIKDVQVLGVGVGPGSWTGSRVAVVTAKGLLEGLQNLKVCTFNTFDLISYNDIEKQGKIYLGKAYADFVYASIEGGEPTIITKSELKENCSGLKWFALEPFMEGVQVKAADIRSVIEGKIMAGEFSKKEDIEPIYLRLSQAEYQFMEKNKGGKING